MGYLTPQFNADQAVDQSVVRTDDHGYYPQAPDLAVTHENGSSIARWHANWH